MLKIIANSQELDLGTLKGITLKFSPGLLDNDSTEGSYSIPFTLPDSDINNAIFEFPYRAGYNKKEVRTLAAELWHSGIKIKEGTIEASKFGKGSISCNFYIDNGGLYSDFNEKNLPDNDFGGEKAFEWKTEYDADTDDFLLYTVKNPNYYKDHPSAYDEANNWGINQNYYAQGVGFEIPINIPAVITPFPVVWKVLKYLFEGKGYQFTDGFFNSDDLKTLNIFNTNNAVKTEVYLSGGYEYLKNLLSSYDLANHLPDIPTGEFIKALQNFFNIKFYVVNNHVTIIDRLAMIASKGYDDVSKRAIDDYIKENTDYESDGVAISIERDDNDEHMSDLPDIPDTDIHFVTDEPVSGVGYKAYEMAFQTVLWGVWWQYTNYKDIDPDLGYDWFLWYAFPNKNLFLNAALSYSAVSGFYKGGRQFKIDAKLCTIPRHFFDEEFNYSYSYLFPRVKYKGNSDRHEAITDFKLRLLLYNGVQTIEETWNQPHGSMNVGEVSVTPYWSYKYRWSDFIAWYNQAAKEEYEQKFQFSAAEIKNFDFSRKKMLNGNIYFITEMNVQLLRNSISPATCKMMQANEFPSVPVIRVNPDRIYFETVTVGSSSLVQSVNVVGIALKNNLVIQANYDFYISENGTTWKQNIELTPEDGAVNKTIYLRFSPTIEQSYYRNITLNSIGADEKTIGVSGIGLPQDPVINTNKTALNFGIININQSSSEVSAIITGYHLTDDIDISMPVGFKVSTDNVNYSDSATLIQTDGVVNQTVYFKFYPLSEQSYSDNIVISSIGAVSKNISVSGIGSVPNPIINLSQQLLAFGNINKYSRSDYKSVNVVASDLTDNLIITCPSGFLISASTDIFYASLEIAPVSGAINMQVNIIFYPFSPSIDNYDSNISFQSTGAVTKLLRVTGTAGDVTPKIYASPASLDFGKIPINTSNLVKQLAIEGVNLISNINISCSSGFKISSDGVNFSTSLALIQSGGTISATLYVLFAPLAIQSYSGNINLNASAANSVNVQLNGLGVASLPIIDADKENLKFGTVVINTNSNSIQITPYAINLTANLTVSAPTGFQVSIDDVNFSSSVSIQPVGGEISEKIVYARFAPSSLGSYSGNISLSSTDADTYNVQVSGTSVNPSPVLALSDGSKDFGILLKDTVSDSVMVAVAGRYLEDSIIISVSDNFEISDDDSNWTNELIFNPVGDIYNVPFYVRFAPTAKQGYVGSIVATSTGATSVSMALYGTGIGSPVLDDPDPDILDFGPWIINVNSTSLSFTITATDIIEDVTVSAPANFEVSSNNITFGNSLIIQPFNGVVNSEIWVRFKATDTIVYDDNISISSTGLTTKYVNVTGEGEAP